MRILLVFILFTSQMAFAQRSLNRDAFMIKVRPVLNGILNDFYQMISQFPDFPKELIPLIQEMETLGIDKDSLKETCPRLIDNKCRQSVEAIRKKLSKIKLMTMNVIQKQKMSSALHINSLSGLRHLTQFDVELEEIKTYFDNTSFLSSAQLPQKRETHYALKELDELDTILSLSIVDYVPFNYREDFRHFYFNFIHPIQQQISKNINYEYLNRNIKSLNFAINLLNMNLTKRKKTPEGMGSYLSIMHIRWNSILRNYF